MKKITILLILFFAVLVGYSQSKYVLQNDKGRDRIRFKQLNNLIIIPVEINGAELSFLLDSGVRNPIIFNVLHVTDSLKVNDAETVQLRGLGEGEPVKAIRSKNNIFKIGDAINVDQTMFMIFDERLDFTPRLGIPVHGIIGYDLFKDFIVEINYSSNYLKLHDPATYEYKTCKKCETFDLDFYNNKPYFNIHVDINDKKIPVKLLIDSGGSDALWLFEDSKNNIKLENKYFESFLGYGLNGSVYGKRSRVNKIHINNFELKHVNVSFPDSTSVSYVRQFEERNGSFSGGLIKRFNIILDYPNAKITLRKNKYFDEPFSYNKAGIEVEQKGIRVVKENVSSVAGSGGYGVSQNTGKLITNTSYRFAVKPAYNVVELRKDSPAYRIGVQKGDVLVSINSKAIYNYTLQEVTEFFYGEENKKIRLKVERNGIPLTFVFRLEDPLK